MQEGLAGRSLTRRGVLRGLGIGVVTLAVGAAAGCSGEVVGAESRIHDVTSFGAVGDGSSDDSDAIIRALAALRPGDTLVFPKGKVFRHSKVLSVTTRMVRLIGPGTLSASNEQYSAFKVEAAEVTLDNLTFSIESTTKRWSTPDQHKLVLGPYDGIVVRDVVISGSAAAGLFCFGSSNFVLQRVQVTDTRADGIHMTNGASHGSVDAPLITRSGDDGVAVVSYLGDGKVCGNISITMPMVRATRGGRGLSVVGGQSITYTRIDVADTDAAGVYIACEGGPSGTFPSRDVRVSGGTIAGANIDNAINHGAVLIYSGRDGGDVSGVTIAGLTIHNTRSTASWQVGVVADGDDALSDVSFENLVLDSHPQPCQANTPLGTVTLSNVSAAGENVALAR